MIHISFIVQWKLIRSIFLCIHLYFLRSECKHKQTQWWIFRINRNISSSSWFLIMIGLIISLQSQGISLNLNVQQKYVSQYSHLTSTFRCEWEHNHRYYAFETAQNIYGELFSKITGSLFSVYARNNHRQAAVFEKMASYGQL